jgi:hypothetical protein
MSTELQTSSSPGLLPLEVTIQFIDTAESPDEVQNLLHQAEVAREIFKRQRARHKMYLAAEIKLRCERKLGAMLTDSKDERRRRYLRDVSLGKLRGRERSLPDGISHMESLRWRRMAEVPESAFREWVAERRAANLELTQSGLLSLAAEHIRKARPSLKVNDDGVDDDRDDVDDVGEDDDISDYVHRTVLCTTVTERKELLERSEVLQLALGLPTIQSAVLAALRLATEEDE